MLGFPGGFNIRVSRGTSETLKLNPAQGREVFKPRRRPLFCPKHTILQCIRGLKKCTPESLHGSLRFPEPTLSDAGTSRRECWNQYFPFVGTSRVNCWNQLMAFAGTVPAVWRNHPYFLLEPSTTHTAPVGTYPSTRVGSYPKAPTLITG